MIVPAIVVPPTRPGYGPNYVLFERPAFAMQIWPGFVVGLEI